MKTNDRLKTEMYRLIDRWESSGLNQKEFCRAEGLNYYKFKYWRTQRRKEQVLLKKHQVDIAHEFIPISMPETQNSISGIELTFPNGVKLTFTEGLQPEQIKELVKLF